MGFCIGSIQILVNFEKFKLSWNISLSKKGLKSPVYSQQAIWALKCIRERFNDSLKISKFTRICMEKHSSMTGWQKFFPRVVVLSPFLSFGGCCNHFCQDNYGWNFKGYLVLILQFQFLLDKIFHHINELFSCLKKVDHMTSHCKRPIQSNFMVNNSL